MMKKYIIIFILLIAIIIVAILANNDIKKSKVEYELQTVTKYEYSKYRQDDKYGVIDRDGNIIIEAKYQNIEIPNPEKAIFICHEESKNTIALNEKNEKLFEKYNKVEAIKLKDVASILCYEKSILKYEKDGKFGLIDFDGKEITHNEYSSIENLQGTEGKFVVCKEDKYGIINLSGTVLVEPKYNQIETDGYFDEDSKYEEAGFIVSNTTEQGYRYGYVNYKGENVLGTEYNDIIRITGEKDIYLIASKNGQYGLYKEGKQLIKTEYQSISYTDGGTIILEKNEQYGISNLKGEIKVKPSYNQVEERGIYLYAENDKKTDVYDKNGDIVEINPSKTIYKTENEKYNIVTLVNNDITYYGIEDSKGTELVETSYNYIEYAFKDYFIAINKNDKYGIIKSNGKEELEFEYDLIQKIKDKNIIQASKKDSKSIDYYSINMEKILTIKSAKIENKQNYIRVYNDKDEEFFNKDGDKINSDSSIILDEINSELPNNIGEYTKYQYSLDDVYYTKQ